VFELWCIDMSYYALRFLCENDAGGIVDEKWIGLCPYNGGQNSCSLTKIPCKKEGGFVWVSSKYRSMDDHSPPPAGADNDDAAAEGGAPKWDSVEFEFTVNACRLQGKHLDNIAVSHMQGFDRDGTTADPNIPGDPGGNVSHPRTLLSFLPAGGALGFSCCPDANEQTSTANAPSIFAHLSATGSRRNPGVPGLPLVYTRRPNAFGLASDDAVTVEIVVDNNTGAPLFRNLEICGDRSVMSPELGPKRLTGLFRTLSGGEGIMNPVRFDPGRTSLAFAITNAAIRAKIANIVDRQGSVNLPLSVILDDPAADVSFCELDATDKVSFDGDTLGFRRRAGGADSNRADAYYVVQQHNRPGDRLDVQLSPLDLPRVPFKITGLELVGGEFGGNNLPGFDAVELRAADPICPAQPDLSPLGLIRFVGVPDGIGEVRTGPPPTRVTLDVPDFCVGPGLPGPVYVGVVLVPGESLPGPITALGADEATHTLIGCSSFTPDGVPPASDFGYGNFMLRALIDGDGATFAFGVVRQSGPIDPDARVACLVPADPPR
jgi:hypothetical protein